VAELARATTARIALEPASSAAITNGDGVIGMEGHPGKDARRRDYFVELQQRT
jgi:hypothetical protein